MQQRSPTGTELNWRLLLTCCMCFDRSATKVLQISSLLTLMSVPDFMEIHPKVDETFQSHFVIHKPHH